MKTKAKLNEKTNSLLRQGIIVSETARLSIKKVSYVKLRMVSQTRPKRQEVVQMGGIRAYHILVENANIHS